MPCFMPSLGKPENWNSIMELHPEPEFISAKQGWTQNILGFMEKNPRQHELLYNYKGVK